MNTPVTWESDNSSNSNQLRSFVREEAFESRLSSLKDVALNVLNAIELLENTKDEGPRKLNLAAEVRRFETDLIQAALVRTRGNQMHAARLLGVKHTTLNAKIKRYGIATSVQSGNGSHHDVVA